MPPKRRDPGLTRPKSVASLDDLKSRRVAAYSQVDMQYAAESKKFP